MGPALTCPECGYKRCECAAILSRPKVQRHCAFCPNGGLPTFHGKCTDPYGDKGICYCFAQSTQHRLQHEQWIAPDDDGREGADGLDSSRLTVDWQEDRQVAAAHAGKTGSAAVEPKQ